jgi:acetyltransferase
LPQDLELLNAFFHGLSADARCSRFMHPVSELSSELLRQDTADHRTRRLHNSFMG